MALKKIRMELGRSAEFPEGSGDHRYEITAPLTADGHLDAEAYKQHKAECRIARFWPGEPIRQGLLIHTRKGWAFSYEKGEEDDETLYKLDRHLFKPGEYVTVAEPDGDAHTFKVVEVS
ncbi:MAG: hypothetical protein RIB41_02470 [Oceanibaculum nanhaiense]|jgi:hypothetical protein|uniref:hypothetical protein n=1 Tax=Oceanibaculum nanhaiense TaxID=1909734 RepID=UPI0032EF0FDE